MYGSILIAVTFKPVVFNRRPVDDAVHAINDDDRRYEYLFDVDERVNVIKGHNERISKVTSHGIYRQTHNYWDNA